jgi:hypothetical protein
VPRLQTMGNLGTAIMSRERQMLTKYGRWRGISSGLMLLGFPVWMWYWIQSPHVLVYLYALGGYLVLGVYLCATSD